MFKIVGSAFVMLSVMMLSYHPLYRLKVRIKMLNDFIHDFQYMHRELSTNLCSLPEIIDLLCKYSGESTNNIYQTLKSEISEQGITVFYESWPIIISPYKIILTPNEYESLIQICNVLGQYILEEQILIIQNTIDILDDGCSSTKEEYREKEKLYWGLGTSIGLILVILLI